jgi:hypothetical protein
MHLCLDSGDFWPLESGTSMRVCWRCCYLELMVLGSDSGCHWEPWVGDRSGRSEFAAKLSGRQPGYTVEAEPERAAMGRVRASAIPPERNVARRGVDWKGSLRWIKIWSVRKFRPHEAACSLFRSGIETRGTLQSTPDAEGAPEGWLDISHRARPRGTFMRSPARGPTGRSTSTGCCVGMK